MTDGTLTGVVEAVETTAENNDEQITDYLAALVGEGKKYKTPADLAKGYLNADLHLRELRDKLDDKDSQNQLLNEVLETIRKPTSQAAPVQPTVVDPAPSTDIAKTVDELLRKRSLEEETERRRKTTTDKLTELYGSKDAWARAVKSITDKNPSMKEILNQLADTDPEACVAFITLRAPKSVDVPNAPGVGGKPSAAAVLEIPKHMTWTQARKIKKENPALYNSPAFRQKLEATAAEWARENKDFFAS